MKKVILITGSTDGIGFETAKMLIEKGQEIIIHGIDDSRVKRTQKEIFDLFKIEVDGFSADLTDNTQIDEMVKQVKVKYEHLDVLINNAGVFVVKNELTKSGFDIRFVVNTIAPYYLTKQLLPLLPKEGRIVNLSSAAQATVDLKTLGNGGTLDANAAYAQSKLALTMWGAHLGSTLKSEGGPRLVSINPKSFLGSKMVKDAYGFAGHDLRIGADILTRAALAEEFENCYGEYYNNDIGGFDQPHIDARDQNKNAELVKIVESITDKF